MTHTSGTQRRDADRKQVPESRVTDLTRPECLDLLASQQLGRLAVVFGRETPVIRPVNYLFDRPTHSVVFRTAGGSKLHALRRATRAVFEIDGTDLDAAVAWSVIVQGLTTEVTQPNDIARLNDLNLQPWAPGHKPHWIRIGVWTVSGRRFPLPHAEQSEQHPLKVSQ